MAEQKWFVFPAEHSPGHYAVIRWTNEGHAHEEDYEHDCSFESAQARADQLNVEIRNE